ncbi:histidine kinase N-terminal 7TM domain-containing protein [Halorubellus sp. PRR65]|uniref:histidine kinase N-terminal 7TM domain-containing protein n=1 Tax=Halorubellus sp. PRR65 TaxID=3098148 RepID=UPI002B2576B7|nr:histidine kinase N-terminal 7TM domain-containing protein [Halorubellus sp. PRR65]
MLRMPPVPWLLVLAATLAVALGIAVRSYRARDRPGATAFAVQMVGIAVWCGSYALQLFATTESTYLALLRVEYLGTVFVPVAWLVFVLEYTGRDDLVTRDAVAAMLVVPVAALVAVWTNPTHHLMWAERSLATAGGLGASTLNAGFWVYLAHQYFLVAGSLWFLLSVVIDRESPHRRQAVALVVATLVPVVVQVGHLVGPAWAPTVNLTPFSFVLSGVIAIVALERLSFLESGPATTRIADDRVVSELDDGVLVVDATGTVLDANRTAGRLLDADVEGLRGRSVESVVPTASTVDELAAFGAETATLSVDGEDRHVKVSASTVTTSRGKHSGWVVTLHDATPELRRQRRTEVLNRVLRETLRDGMDVVSTRATQAVPDDRESEATAAIRERARSALAVGDAAEEFEALLDAGRSDEPVDVVPAVQAAADAVRESFPAVDVTVEAPLGEWAYCGGLFEPTVRALLRFGAIRADAQGVGTVVVDVEVVDESEVRVTLAVPGTAPSSTVRALLEDGVDVDDDLDVESSDELSCWLVHWGVDRLDGSVAVTDDGVSLRVPRHGEPRA